MEEKCSKNDYLKEKNILLRSYQIKLIEKAKAQNSIIFLPTGGGKTLIAVHVLCSKSSEIKSDGKKAFFVAPTKILVVQLAKVLKAQTKFKIGVYTGDINVDSWNKSVWDSEFQKYEVLVLTAEILRIILIFKYLDVSKISLIVFDECHHAVLNHPYNGVMKAIKHFDSPEQPLILGLTATLLNSTPKKTVAEDLEKLQTALDAKILTEVEFHKITRFIANPEIKSIGYDPLNLEPLAAIQNIYQEAIEVGKLFVPSSLSNVNTKNDALQLQQRKNIRSPKKYIENALLALKELGVFGGSITALFYIIFIEKQRLLTTDNFEIQTLSYMTTQLNKIRRKLAKIMGNTENADIIYEHSSPKLQKLIDIVCEKYAFSNGEPNISTIVFVHRRITAIVLAFILNRLKKHDKRFEAVNSEFVISSSKFSCDTHSLSSKNEEIVKRFSAQELNLLFATNILEEGIDICNCNVVISFDFPLNFVSFIQSRGRGRDKTSDYYVFHASHDISKMEILKSYFNVEKELNRVVCANVESDEGEKNEILKDQENTETRETLTIMCKSGKEIKIDGSLAITCVYRYCSLLPQDRFACLQPLVWYRKSGGTRVGYLELPIISPLRITIEGEERNNIMSAKMSVFLKTVKMLYELGELDDSMSPKRFDIETVDFKDLFPHFKNISIEKGSPMPGTSKRKQIYHMKSTIYLSECLPVPGGKTYLHVMDFSVAFDKPELDRKVTLYDLLKSPCTYGILTSKKLPKVCRFPLFWDMGQIDCNFLVNFDEFVLTSAELEDIKIFHFTLFKDVLMGVLKPSQAFDVKSKDFSYFIVPLRKTVDTFALNWDVIKSDFCQRCASTVVPYNPSSENARKQCFEQERRRGLGGESNTCKSVVPSQVFDDRSIWDDSEEKDEKCNFILTEATYSNFVISPNYRPSEVRQLYVVSSFCHHMSPLSPFPRQEYRDFLAYYKDKYDIDIRNSKQPLLKVSALPKCANYNQPKYEEKGASRRYTMRDREYEEHLVPELCHVYPFLKSYWMKAVLIPTALERISNIYRAEQLRRLIASETGLGVVELEEGVSWKPLEVQKWALEPPTSRNDNQKSLQKLEIDLPLSRLKNKEKSKEASISAFDPERHLYEIGLCDLEAYIERFRNNGAAIEECDELAAFEKCEKMMTEALLEPVDVPKLKIFSDERRNFGPELADVLQACTSKSANDIVDYEKLEILGDSFLKFSTTFFLFKRYPLVNEGILTNVKGKLVGNRNLLDCGTAKNLCSFINVLDFSPTFDWIPPLFSTPELIANEILSENIDPAIMTQLIIPEQEQISGKLSSDTIKRNKDILEKEGRKSVDVLSNPLLRRHLISDKTVADVVEALMGLYLSDFGLEGGFKIANWLEILPGEGASFSQIMKEPFSFQLLNNFTDEDVENLLKDVFVDDLEALLNYKFKNRAILLEALTHPSHPKNRVTLCYQRLEFLGDAVLDFLITSYLFEFFPNLDPGKVTDVRVSLVNNVTFACLTVRYNLHKYLLSASASLSKAIDSFVAFQMKRNHLIDEAVLIKIEEDNCLLAENISVPKALGDVFESIAGAIFIDSGNSLETVWRVFYNLMKREIEEFSKNPPVSAVRLLHEICGVKPYFETIISEYSVAVKCVVLYNDYEITSYGCGRNKQEGKISASKMALKKILDLKNEGQ